MNILDEANKIVNERSEEKERSYGSFSEGMKRAASIASGMTGKDITANDMFACMVALKFSRQSFNHKTDNLLDAVAYIGAWNNFIDEESAKKAFKEVKVPAPTYKYEIDDYDETINKYSKIVTDELKEIERKKAEQKEYVAEDLTKNEKEFKEKFEEEVFGKKTESNRWSQMSPAQAFRELEEKLQVMTDCLLAIHNNSVNIKDDLEKTKAYTKYLAENIDKTISYAEYLAGKIEQLGQKDKPIDGGDAGPN